VPLPGVTWRFWGIMKLGLLRAAAIAVCRTVIASDVGIRRPSMWVVHVLCARLGAAGAAGGAGVTLLAVPALLCAKIMRWRGLAVCWGFPPVVGRFREMVWRLAALKWGTLLGVPTLGGGLAVCPAWGVDDGLAGCGRSHWRVHGVNPWRYGAMVDATAASRCSAMSAG
jgi:hypothetical protein